MSTDPNHRDTPHLPPAPRMLRVHQPTHGRLRGATSERPLSPRGVRGCPNGRSPSCRWPVVRSCPEACSSRLHFSREQVGMARSGRNSVGGARHRLGVRRARAGRLARRRRRRARGSPRLNRHLGYLSGARCSRLCASPCQRDHCGWPGSFAGRTARGGNRLHPGGTEPDLTATVGRPCIDLRPVLGRAGGSARRLAHSQTTSGRAARGPDCPRFLDQVPPAAANRQVTRNPALSGSRSLGKNIRLRRRGRGPADERMGSHVERVIRMWGLPPAREWCRSYPSVTFDEAARAPRRGRLHHRQQRPGHPALDGLRLAKRLAAPRRNQGCACTAALSWAVLEPRALPRTGFGVVDVTWSSDVQPSPVDDSQCVISRPGHA
jgi:hypothetical protein